MRSLTMTMTAVCLTLPISAHAQGDLFMVEVGTRVRLSVTETVLPSPRSRPGRLRQVTGTVREIASDTIRLEVSADSPSVAVPRILLYKVERSLGRTRAGSAGDAALIGGGVGALLQSFFKEKHVAIILGSGYALGGLVGAVRPYERWEHAWIPE